MNPSFFVISTNYPTRRGCCLKADRPLMYQRSYRCLSAKKLQAYLLPQCLPLLQEVSYIPFSYIVYFLFHLFCFRVVGADRCVCPIFAVFPLGEHTGSPLQFVVYILKSLRSLRSLKTLIKSLNQHFRFAQLLHVRQCLIKQAF